MSLLPFIKDKMINAECRMVLKQYDLLSHCFTDQITHFCYDSIKMKPQLYCVIFKGVF